MTAAALTAAQRFLSGRTSVQITRATRVLLEQLLTLAGGRGAKKFAGGRDRSLDDVVYSLAFAELERLGQQPAPPPPPRSTLWRKPDSPQEAAEP